MYKKVILIASGCFLIFILNGCALRTYSVTKDRVDQDLSTGNRGFLTGESKTPEEIPRKKTRQVHVVEMELRPLAEGRAKSAVAEPGVSPVESGKEAVEKPSQVSEIKTVFASPVEPSKTIAMKKYTVLKGDTLQSISKKFFGTTKRWQDIYKANSDVLKSPDKIYPGQIINIPIEKATGTK